MDVAIVESVYCLDNWERAPGLYRLGKNLGLVPGRAILELVVDAAPEADYCCWMACGTATFGIIL